jgi:hypothetical protein
MKALSIAIRCLIYFVSGVMMSRWGHGYGTPEYWIFILCLVTNNVLLTKEVTSDK